MTTTDHEAQRALATLREANAELGRIIQLIEDRPARTATVDFTDDTTYWTEERTAEAIANGREVQRMVDSWPYWLAAVMAFVVGIVVGMWL